MITLLVGIFKTEKDSVSENGDEKITVYQNYTILWEIFKLPRIRVLLVALFTARVNIVRDAFLLYFQHSLYEIITFLSFFFHTYTILFTDILCRLGFAH